MRLKHGRVFFILGIRTYFCYAHDKRREKLARIYQDPGM